jgi:hypothetical protein
MREHQNASLLSTTLPSLRRQKAEASLRSHGKVGDRNKLHRSSMGLAEHFRNHFFVLRPPIIRIPTGILPGGPSESPQD